MKNKRWLENMIKATEENTVRMPWERGLRRQAMIARRNAKEAQAPTAKAA